MASAIVRSKAVVLLRSDHMVSGLDLTYVPYLEYLSFAAETRVGNQKSEYDQEIPHSQTADKPVAS